MQMELANHVAERADIDLVGLRVRLEKARRQRRLFDEKRAVFQRSHVEEFWLSHLDLAYTLPFLGRIDEAKAHVAALLKMNPSMTIAEADALYKLLFCFEPAFREKMARALRQAGLPEGEAKSI